MERGKYICLEGGDGCGKTTVAVALEKRLGEKSFLVRFPSDGVIGRLIRKGLKGEEPIESKPFLYLFAADGLQQDLLIRDVLEERGKHIICNRHPTISGRVYQRLHHPPEVIDMVYDLAYSDGITPPDFLFIVEVSTDEALSRMAARNKYKDVVFEKEDPEYVEMIRKRYREISIDFGGTMLDGHRKTEELVDEVLSIAGIC